jgi:hypothetical protein
MSTFTQKIKDQLQNRYNSPQVEDSISLKRAITPPAESSEIGGLLILQDRDLISARRMVVLIPNSDFDEAVIAREIWKLAFPPGLAVLFLGLCPSVNEEPRMRRRLATVAALTRDPRVPVDVQLEFGRNWISKLKAVLEDGDIVVCHAEQRTGFFHQPLELVLARLNIPMLTLKGFTPSMYKSPSIFLREAVFWLVSVAIVVGFFWLQVQTLRISEAWAKNILLGLSVPVEISLLWLWHALSN